MTRPRLKITLLLLITIITFSTVVSAQVSEITFTERLTSLAEVSKAPAFTAIKMSTGVESAVYVGGILKFGDSDRSTTNSIMVHGALNPLIVAIATMKAIEQGHFELDTPVNDVLPFQVVHPNDRNTPITVRHLLGHTSGIQDESGSFFKNYLFTKDINYNQEVLNSDEKRMLRRANLNSRLSLQALLEKSLTPKGDFYSKSTFSRNSPGDEVLYSSTGLSLLALVVESSTGYFFDQFTTEYIFEPLGMSSATWTIPGPGSESASPHLGSSLSVIPDYNQILYPSLGFRASVNDAQMLLGEVMNGLDGKGTLLDRESWRSLFGGLIPVFQNATIPEMNAAPIEVSSSYNMAGYHVIGAQNYGSTSVLLIEPQKGEAIYFASNTSFAHLNRGGFFLSEIMRLLVEPYEQ
jgi:CubicO group peptidase (beta-lactamase class C family)